MKSKNSFFYSIFESHERAYRKLRNHEQENIMYQQLQNKTVQNMEKEQNLKALQLAKIKELQDALKKEKEEQEKIKKEAKADIKNEIKNLFEQHFIENFNIKTATKSQLLQKAIMDDKIKPSEVRVLRDQNGIIVDVKSLNKAYTMKTLRELLEPSTTKTPEKNNDNQAERLSRRFSDSDVKDVKDVKFKGIRKSKRVKNKK